MAQFRSHLVLTISLFSVCLAICDSRLLAQVTPHVLRFSVPGAGANANQGTMPNGINSAGVVSGSFRDAQFKTHGFVRDLDGSFTTFDALPGGAGDTFPTGINASGAVAGYGKDQTGMFHGFLRNVNGTVTAIDVPGQVIGSNAGTRVFALNNSGECVGSFFANVQGVPLPKMFGFIRLADGTYRTFGFPGYVNISAVSVNSRGVIAGYGLEVASGALRSFVLMADGTFTFFSAPLATDTFATYINDSGAIAGIYTDANRQQHGFLRQPDGSLTTVDVPNSIFTEISGLNNSGEILVNAQDQTFAYHQYIRKADGSFSLIDLSPTRDTLAAWINAHSSVVGALRSQTAADIGFILSFTQ